jgi:cytochrome c oxidase cbb3-type subunit 1
MAMGAPNTEAEGSGYVAHQEIDASCRWPVLILFAGAIKCLVVGLLLGVVAAIKMHAPNFIAHCPWMTFGRVKPAFFDAILYGFVSQAALGAALWMLARLGRNRLSLPGLASAGAIVWNVGILVGVLQILGGQSTGLAWMEIPRQGASLLAGGFFLIAISAFYTLLHRQQHELFVSQWFIIAALFAFPWLLSVAYLLGVVDPVRGVMQAVVNAWFTNGIQYLWLTPLGLAVAYYLLPKYGGSPVYSNQGAAFGFWTLVVFGNWSGLSQLAGGPLPRWMLATGSAAKLVLLVPALAFALNWELTHRAAVRKPARPAGASFLSLGAWAFVLMVLMDALSSVGSFGLRVSLTPYATGVTYLGVFGFASMVLFAAIYHIVPRLLPTPWALSGLIRVHVVVAFVGTALAVAGGVLGGYSYGGALLDPGIPFVSAAKGLTPFLGLTTLGLTLLLVGGLVLSLNFLLTLLRGTAEARAAFCSWCCGCGTSSDKKARAGA